MLDKNAVCQKVTELNPDLGICGTDIETFYSKGRDSWVIASKKGDRVHYLDKEDIKKCLDGVQCFSLGIDISEIT
ncbi:MAG: hypothetical protein JSW69_00985 [Deltaproteobacteria bacterium]|jgi:hypothetical protein|nr:MAG: hypothetical protein JSW69_00985 [Deltaproteobacteria bacterium]